MYGFGATGFGGGAALLEMAPVLTGRSPPPVPTCCVATMLSHASAFGGAAAFAAVGSVPVGEDTAVAAATAAVVAAAALAKAAAVSRELAARVRAAAGSVDRAARGWAAAGAARAAADRGRYMVGAATVKGLVASVADDPASEVSAERRHHNT